MMPMSRLQDELAEVFSRHGRPSYEEPGWAAVMSLLVLMMQNQEIMMSTIADLTQKVASEASALVDLNSGVAAFIQALPAGTTTGAPGTTFLTADDQSKIDSIAATLDANIGKIGEIKTLLTTVPTPATPAPTPPPAGAGPVSPTPPVVGS
jgi:hypothetical protein